MRVWRYQTSGVTLAELRDIFEVVGVANRLLKILGWELLQSSELGDAQEEILRLETVYGIGTVTTGSGGSVPTGRPTNRTNSVTAPTVEANNTTRMAAGTGTLEVDEQHGWNVRMPWLHWYIPEARPEITPADRWTLALPVAPNDSITGFATTLWVGEEA